MSVLIQLRDLSATARLAQEIAAFVTDQKVVSLPVVIALSGPLGVGKTEFVRAFAAALNSPDEASSPTFVLENIYATPTGLRIHHWDLYRLNEESPDLIEALRDPRGIVIIEWAERLPLFLRHAALALAFDFGEKRGPEERSVEIRSSFEGLLRERFKGLLTESGEGSLEILSGDKPVKACDPE